MGRAILAAFCCPNDSVIFTAVCRSMGFHFGAKMFVGVESTVLSTFGVGRAFGWLRGGLCHLRSGLSSIEFC